MRVITVKSEVHGPQRILLDDQDYNELSQYTWGVKTAGGPNRNLVAVRRNVLGEHVLLHRELLQCWRGEKVIHKSGNTLDNRRKNLQIV